MFGSKQEDLKDKAINLASNAKNDFEKAATDVKRGAEDLAINAKRGVEDIGHDLQAAATDGKHQAMGVINSLKGLLAQYTNSSNVNELKEQILDKAFELKNTVGDDVSRAYNTGKERTAQTVQEKPLLSLGLAVGAGVLLGYILGSKSSK